LTIGMVIRKVTGSSMSAFAEKNLWQPMGAENSATWATDSLKNEFNCIGFAATLRDWARLGTLIANRGRVENVQVISESWIKECTSWSDKDKQVRVGIASSRFGYKAHMWHNKSDGSRLYFNGHHGQRVIVDMPTRTVMVHTAVDHDGNWQAELFEMFEAATRS
jgi:CubicO group peptidase (beta-lactamase class C family)